MIEVFPANILRPSQLLSIKCCTFCFLVLSIFIFSFVVQAGTIHIPTDHSTIQAAIDAALDGDTILVASGTYTGEGNKDLDFKGKAITVQSENGPESTIIDCENRGRGFYFHNGEGSNSVLSGFTIKNGNADPSGGGILISASSNPTIDNCIIKENSAHMYGGGIMTDTAPVISNCTIRDNYAGLWGGGFFLGSSTTSAPIIINSEIMGNTAQRRGGGIYSVNSSPEILNTIISYNFVEWGGISNGGGAIYFVDTGLASNPILTNCTIVKNSATDGGAIYIDIISTFLTITNCTIAYNESDTGGLWVKNRYDASINISNSIIWENNSEEIFMDPFASGVNVTFSTIDGGWPGESNLALYPIFMDPANNDFNLKNSSPCIGTGKLEGSPDKDTNGAPRPDPSDSKPDIGAYENSLASPEIPSLEDLLDIFGIELGNRWTYEGTYQGELYSIEREFIALNRSSFPVPTYVNQIRQDGIIIGKEWYEKTEDQIKLWGTTTEYEGATYTINFSEGLKAAWYPMAVNDHEYSSALTDILGLSFNASLTVDVLNSEMIVLNFDTLEAFKVQYQFHLWGNSLNVTDTFIWWIVPYLGVIKEQRADSIGKLNSFALAGGNMTYPGDADGDNISDYYEFSIYNTHWLLDDTDHDGLEDGFEVDYWGTSWNEDPDGDLLINLLDPDSDNDGLNDGVEVLGTGTDPALADSDGNGLSDGEEVQCGSDPLDPNSKCTIGLPWLMLLLD